MFTHVLVPTDGSSRSRKAIRAAALLAKSLNARITSIHVTVPFRPAAVDFYMPYEEPSLAQYNASVGKSAAKVLAQAQKACKEVGVACEILHVSDAEPHRAIIAAAKRKRCDLVVMASHGRRGIAAVVLGSETSKVLTHSKIPVLVYR